MAPGGPTAGKQFLNYQFLVKKAVKHDFSQYDQDWILHEKLELYA